MNDTKRIQHYGILLIFIFPALFTLLLFVLQWPEWWTWIVFELTPMGWMQSVLLMFCALTAAYNGLVNYITPHQAPAYRTFLLMAIAFFCLALDERFALHERMRDKFLAPHHVTFPLFPWVEPGNFILLLFLMVGLALLTKFLRVLTPLSKKFFVVGTIIAAIAILMDSFEYTGYSVDVQRWEQFIEEQLEETAMCHFLAAQYLTLVEQLTTRAPKLSR